MYKAILKQVFDSFLKFFHNVLDIKKALSISSSCPEVLHPPLQKKKITKFEIFMPSLEILLKNKFLPNEMNCFLVLLNLGE
jgi:hypothetical protein